MRNIGIDIFVLYLLNKILILSTEDRLYYEELFVYLVNPLVSNFNDEEFFEWIKNEVSLVIGQYGYDMATSMLE